MRKETSSVKMKNVRMRFKSRKKKMGKRRDGKAWMEKQGWRVQ